MEINKAFIKALGYEDFRDFFIDLGQFYYTGDFTYNEQQYKNLKKGLKAFVVSVCGDNHAKAQKIIIKFNLF
jgi:hypothetical protein